ncbi:hypothetical protein P7K49_032012, partial [Saguinus oedipus]
GKKSSLTDIKDIEACLNFTEPLNETLLHSQTAPMAEPRTANAITELEMEVSQLKGDTSLDNSRAAGQ